MCVNLDAEVMTLYPKKPITTLVRIGWSQDDSASDYLCSTPRSLMKAEDKYEVVLWFLLLFLGGLEGRARVPLLREYGGGIDI